jgi:nucleoside-diphosphate-sugar epimerase
MTKTVLILGASGRFGRSALAAFSWAGWETRCFDRETDTLEDAAWGADVIVNGWNPAYTAWANDIPKLTAQVIGVARDTKATVIIPGNVYPYGSQMPELLEEATPHRPTSPLGQIRADMEAAYRAAGVKTIILRAGDFIDTQASGNWYDKVITAGIVKGKLSFPGDLDAPHAWAYLPDMAEAAVALAERAEGLGQFTEVNFSGFTLTGRELHVALEQVTGSKLALQEMQWWPLKLLQPFWAMAKPLIEMRYLWNVPHTLSGEKLQDLIPEYHPTPLLEALSTSLPEDIYPNRTVARRKPALRFCCRPIDA